MTYYSHERIAQELRDLLGWRSDGTKLTAAQWARDNHISPSAVSDVLTGLVKPSPSIRKALGFSAEPYYRRLDP